MQHAEKLIERILYFDGTPSMNGPFKINIGRNVPEQFKNDLQVEYEAVERLNKGIKLCTEVGDAGSRELLEHILVDEEEHIDWLEGQLHAIEEMSIQTYLSQQMEKKESD
jgi:bacterioferritin